MDADDDAERKALFPNPALPQQQLSPPVQVQLPRETPSVAEIQPTIERIRGEINLDTSTVQVLYDAYSLLITCENQLRDNYRRQPEPQTAQLHSSLCEYLRLLQERIQDRVPGPHQYEIIRTVKDTIYGKVKVGIHRRTQTQVALKMSNIAQIEAKHCLENPQEEIRLMRLLNRGPGHPSVLRLLDEFRHGEFYYTILEFCSGGELFDVVAAQGRGLDLPRARQLFTQLMSGVAFLHANDVCHLDLSLENCLLDAHGNLKICDLGMARSIPSPPIINAGQHTPGKLTYMAPEIFARQDFNVVAADIYSCGVILFILLTGTPPYNTPSGVDARWTMIYSGRVAELLARWRMSHLVPDSALSLLVGMLGPPQGRPSVEDILNSSFVRGL